MPALLPRPRARLARTALLAAMFAAGAPLARAQGAALGDFDGHGDVGAPKIAGRAGHDPAAQEYTISAAGVNMWGPRDELHLAWKRLKGDFILQARLRFVGKGTDPHRKAGVIVRTSLDDDSPYADAVVHGDGLTSLQFRRTKGAATEESRSEVKGADVVQLERRGTTLTMSAARFGDLFTTTEVKDLALGDDVYVGLFVCSHNPEVVETAVFDDVRIVRPSPEGFVPYRDYIGSRLEILDVATGARQLVFSSDDQPFEAPNWTRDGKSLVYNLSGKTAASGGLVRFDLAARKGTPIDTGANVHNNNDHVLSFDGKRLAISDATEGGQSSVYTVPLAGGTPKRVTKLVPSYLHGWSPDAKFSRLHRREERRVRRLPDRLRRQRRGGEPHATPRPRRRARVHARREVDLLQLGTRRHHAGLADEAGRLGAAAGHERRAQQLVPARLARREVDRVHHVPEGGRPRRPPVLQACVPAARVPRRRHPEGDRVRVRRPGHDERAVVVTGRDAPRVRQQQRQALTGTGSRAARSPRQAGEAWPPLERNSPPARLVGDHALASKSSARTAPWAPLRPQPSATAARGAIAARREHNRAKVSSSGPMRRIDPGLRGLAAAVVLCASPGASAAMAESARVPHDAAVILRITSDGPSLAAKVDEALRQQLLRVRTGWSEPVIYGQTLGSATGNPQEEQRLGDFLAATYAPRDLQLVLTSGDEALAFVLRQRDRLFPGIPVVFHGADRQAWPGVLPPGVTGVFSASTDALRPTVEAAMRLHRGLERVYAVGDAAHERALRKALSGLSGVEVVYLVGIPTTELLRRLGDLADQSVVCLGRATIDRDERPADLQDVLPALSEMSRVPIYSTIAAHVGRGAVGGVVVPEESTVERVVPLALRVLHGDKGVAPTADAAPVPTFDERQLDRWDVPTGRLPPGSRVLFRKRRLVAAALVPGAAGRRCRARPVGADRGPPRPALPPRAEV